jgi:hypothetical protein
MNRATIPVRKHRARRGQPLVVLILLLTGWVAARAAVWEGPFAEMQTADRPQLLTRASPKIASPPAVVMVAKAATVSRQIEAAPLAVIAPAAISWPMARPVAAAPLPQAVMITPAPLAPRVAAGHQMLWLAVVAQLPLPAVLFERRDEDQATMIKPGGTAKRWSADSWLLLRQDGAATVNNGFSAPSYGASQIGAVIRYRLATGNAHKPSLYLRASGAVRVPHDEEVAAGFSARPLARLPIVAMAEMRVTRAVGAAMLRPAAALVSEFPPLDLPLGLRAEAYAQAGYVGGRKPSAFADGQLHLTRRLARIGGMELRAGGAAWGGAQQGASRVDAGPTASLGLPIGPANTRLSADWRFRIAGSAAPGTGPAVTLSAGF